MRVLSLFDGIACARVALDKLGVVPEVYYASEIDHKAITIAVKNWDIVQLGAVENLNTTVLSSSGIDLVIGGSPCQDLSIATHNRQGLDGSKSKLFWEYVRVIREVKPKYFVLENVASMRKSDSDIITKELGVEPIMFNASLVSAQQRKRYFWTNIPNITLPDSSDIKLADILQYDLPIEEYDIYPQAQIKGKPDSDGSKTVRVGDIGYTGQAGRVYCVCGKSVTINAGGGGAGGKTGLYAVPIVLKANGDEQKKSYTLRVGGSGSGYGDKHNWDTYKIADANNLNDFIVRKLTPVECERLQGLPDNYTEGVSKTQRIRACGNAFNADVVAHILSFIPEIGDKK